MFSIRNNSWNQTILRESDPPLLTKCWDQEQIYADQHIHRGSDPLFLKKVLRHQRSFLGRTNFRESDPPLSTKMFRVTNNFGDRTILGESDPLLLKDKLFWYQKQFLASKQLSAIRSPSFDIKIVWGQNNSFDQNNFLNQLFFWDQLPGLLKNIVIVCSNTL